MSIGVEYTIHCIVSQPFTPIIRHHHLNYSLYLGFCLQCIRNPELRRYTWQCKACQGDRMTIQLQSYEDDYGPRTSFRFLTSNEEPPRWQSPTTQTQLWILAGSCVNRQPCSYPADEHARMTRATGSIAALPAPIGSAARTLDGQQIRPQSVGRGHRMMGFCRRRTLLSKANTRSQHFLIGESAAPDLAGIIQTCIQ